MSTHDEPAVITPFALREWRLPQPGGSKRSRGQVLAVGGSPSTPGAVMLAGLAALRVGAGVLALAVAESVAPTVAVAVPEASVTPLALLDGGRLDDRLSDAVRGADAVLVGPGLDRPEPTRTLLRAVLDVLDDSATLVLDAFALGVLDDVLDGADLGGRALLTPNSTEAAHLLRADADDLDGRSDTDVALELAARYQAAVSYSGAVAGPDGRCWTVRTGHAGLGTSGSGDVLAGAAAGLLARGADPAQAACWATYLHGTAGDQLAARVGRLGFLARELVDELPMIIVQTEA